MLRESSYDFYLPSQRRVKGAIKALVLAFAAHSFPDIVMHNPDAVVRYLTFHPARNKTMLKTRMVNDIKKVRTQRTPERSQKAANKYNLIN